MFSYSDILPQREVEADGLREWEYARLDLNGVTTSEATVGGLRERFLIVEPNTLTELAEIAITEISHYLRSSHLASLRSILEDPDASENDKFVALDLLKNAVVSAGEVLPMCQDTGTAIIHAKRPQGVLTDGNDAEHLARGIFNAYQRLNLRYSQLAPLSLFEEVNTGTNLPAQIEIGLGSSDAYEFLFMAKGGGSANKSFLYQETRAVLDEQRLLDFIALKLGEVGTAACPPYHLAVVVGGTSAEYALKTAKLASAHYFDDLPTQGDPKLGYGIRDHEFEKKVFELSQKIGYGAQFGGKYFCHDVRVVRLPRHNGSLPIALAVSCSADRQMRARITAEGVFIEKLEHDPAQFLPDPQQVTEIEAESVTAIDLNQPMPLIQKQLSELSVGQRVNLSGTLIVARDIAHARLRDMLESGKELPAYVRNHPIYYAGPAKTPDGMESGSFGPTTAARMDTYVEQFQSVGASLVTLAKGNRSSAVVGACKAYGGFYLGTIGGPAALLAQESILSIEAIDMLDLGMEAVWKIEVENFPAFVVIDDKGNDFLARVRDRSIMQLGRTRTSADGSQI